VGTNALGLIHELLLYSTDDELLDTAVPFLRAGFDAGEPGLLVCPEATTSLLRRELGDDPRLGSVNPLEIYATPSGAITAYQEIIDDYVNAGAERVRLVADAAFDPVGARWGEWARYEAVVNHVMRPYPVSAMCAYSTRSTRPAMLASGPATHPYLAHGSVHSGNPFYVQPAVYLRRTATTTEEPLESTPPAVEIDHLVDLDALRRRLELALHRPTLAPGAAADFILAIHEVATNAARHGQPPVNLRLWVTPTQFLCTTTDQGEGFDDPLAGYTWPGSTQNAATGGMGLWLARRLSDRVDMFHSSRGFTVRLLTNLTRRSNAQAAGSTPAEPFQPAVALERRAPSATD
jgi:anti-sigma regulatory factor (Ser/Thr protein kinase)